MKRNLAHIGAMALVTLGALVGIALVRAVAAPAPRGRGVQPATSRSLGANDKPPRQSTTQPAELIRGIRLTGDHAYHNQPAVAQAADQTTWIAWVRYVEGAGDEVRVRSMRITNKEQRISDDVVLTPKPGQYIRPVIAVAGNEVWCFWTESREDSRAAIWYSRRGHDQWSAPQRLLPQENRAQQNIELAAAANGHLAAVYQSNDGSGYRIWLCRWTGKKWDEPVRLSRDGVDAWDPVATFDRDGNLHVAWSGFEGGDYDVYWMKIAGGKQFAPRRLSARGEYDMHPWLAAAPNGRVWINWDVVRIPEHGFSGPSTITGANHQKSKTEPGPFTNAFGHWSGIEVRVIDGEEIRVPGKPREQIVAPPGYVLAHRGMGKIAISANGEPWIVYRALMQTVAAWSPNDRDGYLWEVQARPFREDAWRDAVVFAESDGYLEEPGVVSTRSGIKVVYTSEHRHSTARDVGFDVKKDSAPPISAATRPTSLDYDHHHDFDGFIGWRGDILLAPLPLWLSPEAKIASMPVESKPTDGPVDERLSRAAGRHEVNTAGRSYKLLWGDTHRHSNISRCSVGTEPSPDDLYRYGIDINLYDFLALSDHSEYTTDYYWWRQQKIADLYHIPDFLSVLYNSEWSGRFPNGHVNTVFPDRHKVKMHGWMGDTKTLNGGWELLRRGGYNAVTIPHTSGDPGMGTDWSQYDEQYLRLCEIFQSGRGSYEYDGCPRQPKSATNKKGFYWNALQKGYHVGVICSSDHSYGCAYACVYATDNTREAVWRALYDRRTYGSTTYGLVLEFRSGAHWMGEQFDSTSAPPLEIYVRGSAPIRSVEILGRSKVLHAEGSIEKPLNVKEHRIRWTDGEWDQLQGEQWYYVRVIEQDDEMAWSSPIWVTRR